MTLASYTPPSAKVPIGSDKTIIVTGLSLQAIEILIRTHLPDIEELFDLFVDGGNLGQDDIKKLAVTLATRAPGFTANVIALAAGEPDATANAAKLPFPVQLHALSDIGRLTFAEVGGVKKFMETVAGLLTAMNMKVPQQITGAMGKIGNQP